ncbi:MAG: hypothetical protein AB1689_20500 [Thermodesulfobacteriota bacterium]
MSRATRTIIALAVVTAAASCSSGGGNDGEPTSPPSGPLAREHYAGRLAEWLCDDLAACCEGTGEPFDRERCVLVKTAAELNRVAKEETSSGRVFDEGMAAACMARLAETPPQCGHPRRVLECFRTYDGVVDLGGACSSKFQCRGYVRDDTACIDGRCTTRLAAGEACAVPTQLGQCDVCRPKATCRQAADGNHYCFGVDRQRGVAGDPCEIAWPADPTQVTTVADCLSEDGLYCSGAGVCTPFVATGGACRFGISCSPEDDCVDGVCTPRAVAGEGRRCQRFRDCAEGLRCERAPEDSIGVCVAPPSACTTGLESLERQASRLSQ